MLDARDGRTIARAPGGQISADGTVAAHSRARADGTRSTVVTTDAKTGERVWSATVDGAQQVRLVGHAGQAVVVSPPSPSADNPYRPEPRTQSTFSVVRADGHTSYSLWGNYEPEALSTDGQSLFLIKYTPPTDPQSYQVRRMDLSTGEVLEVYTPDEELQQEMGGTARTQIASIDGRRLYTLYTLQGADGTTEAFVHVLSLDELWAHCIHLPEPFTGSAQSTGLALSDGGDRLYVVDGAEGQIAEVDTHALRVARTAAGPVVSGPERLVADVAEDGRLYVAANRMVDAFDAGSLAITGAYRASGEVTALQALPDGVVRLGVGTQVLVIDTAADATVEAIPAPAGRRVDGFGTAPAPLPEERQALDCAC